MARYPRLAVPVGPSDHVLGRGDARFTLVQYGDYTCPYTRRAATNIELARRKLGSRVRYVFRHFPRAELNPEAPLLAEAAHAAAAQGKFWEMHDFLLDNEETLRDPEALARTIGLDPVRFVSELQARTHRAHVAEELDGGIRSGVTTTPTLFINDRRHIGSWEPMALLRALGGAPALARSAHL
jgi:protein-disulfide isomerase